MQIMEYKMGKIFRIGESRLQDGKVVLHFSFLIQRICILYKTGTVILFTSLNYVLVPHFLLTI